MDTHCVALFDDIYGDYIVVLSSVLYLCNGTYEDPSGNWHELDRAMIGIVLLKRMPNLKVAFSINTLDDNFRADMDKGSSIKDRLHAIEKLHNEGIHTVLFMSPIFPYITEWKDIIDSTKENVCEYWFENLNLRGEYKSSILSYINTHYPDLKEKYEAIYLNKDNTYWNTLADLLNTYCDELGLNYVNYFYF